MIHPATAREKPVCRTEKTTGTGRAIPAKAPDTQDTCIAAGRGKAFPAVSPGPPGFYPDQGGPMEGRHVQAKVIRS
jgi:hypothetical protein